ncbi:hypothetical protein, partial [Thiolapillus sp.]|uniref:hypothetical protein n=2 Tax=Thiolapillus sp. TaxID=2017437 RepID=UPI003AF9B1C6
HGMTDIQKQEIERYRGELETDVRKLVDKYLSISDWDIPEIDEHKSIEYILQVVRSTLDDVENEWKKRSR